MKPLTLCLMTAKGHAFLLDIVDTYAPLIEEVIVGSDAALDNDCAQEIARLCEARGLSWRARSADLRIRTPFVMAVSWRWLIDHPETHLIVFHDSLLPRYRGFNPLVSALINGDDTIGVTALLGASEYDAGDILAQSTVDVSYPIKLAAAIEALRPAYRACAIAVLERIRTKQPLDGRAQEQAQVSYSLWRDEDDYRLDWTLPAQRLARTVDALGSPYQGALTSLNGETLARIHDACALPDVVIANRTPGKVLRMNGAFPVVVCGEGLLEIRALVDATTGASLLPLQRFRSRFA